MGVALRETQGLELRLLWGDVRVAEHFLRPSRTKRFTVGSSPGCDFAMAGSRFEAITADDDGYAVHFTERMRGSLTRGDKTIDLAQAIASGQAEADGDTYRLPVGRNDHVLVDLGGIVMEAFPQRAPKPVAVPLAETMDFAMLNILIVLLFIASLMLIERQVEGDALADDVPTEQGRIAGLLFKAPEPRSRALVQQLENQKAQHAGEPAARHRGSEGEAGGRDAPLRKNTRLAPRGDPAKKDQVRGLLTSVFGATGDGVSTLFGPSGLGGGELVAMAGGLVGDTAGDSRGFGGLGLKGTESGGGGEQSTVGIGRLGTHGRGGKLGDYRGVGVLTGKRSEDPTITTSDIELLGSLDRELVRQVIRAHRNEIRYCYETELPRSPQLSGKVAVKFLISSVGSVQSSRVHESTAGNATLESCVVGRVRGWVFPRPKGGGVVVVTYPFIFARAGE